MDKWLKNAVKSATGDSVYINKKLNSFLCKYRITPQGTTNESPSILIYSRNIRTCVDIMIQDLTTSVMNRQYEISVIQRTNGKSKETHASIIHVRKQNGQHFYDDKVHAQ